MSFTLYTTEDCEYCLAAKELLRNCNREYLEVILNTSDKRKKFKESTGHKTVPQIYHDSGLYIGGYEKLKDYLLNG